MVRLQSWQVAVLILPIAVVLIFLLFAAGTQIHTWGINWIWAIVGVIFVGWRWLLVRWTRPSLQAAAAAVAEIQQELEDTPLKASMVADTVASQQAEAALQQILQTAQQDPPLWEDWATFWQRGQELVTAIAQAYYPEIQRPLLQIYVPQAYGLMRGTVDDLDVWIGKLSPALNQVTLGQAVQAYELYQKLEPSARRLLQVWNWAQWALNPMAAIARQTTRHSSQQANQALLLNLNQGLRDAALRNLARQAIALYSGTAPLLEAFPSNAPTRLKAQTQTLQQILAQAEPLEKVAEQPVNLMLVGRTGSGKSSLINSLFVEPMAAVDVLPSTEEMQDYHWRAPTGETLTLWDSPGYEQADRSDLRQRVLDHLSQVDLLLLLTPALDPALQMDRDFLKAVKAAAPELPVITVVTQVDRLRPLREWQPPYDWQWGDRPKEVAIREASQYRAEMLGEWCDRILPIVTADADQQRQSWGVDLLSLTLLDTLTPAKQLRIARFLRDREARILAAAKIIDHYIFQMTTTQGLTALLKSPVLVFLSELMTGSPALAYLLAEQIPVEQLPVAIGKLQMAYDLWNLLKGDSADSRNFDLLSLWSLILENDAPPDRNAWAFGHAITEYWSQSLTPDALKTRFHRYLQQQPPDSPERSEEISSHAYTRWGGFGKG